MATATQFPAFLKLEYDGSGNGLSDFQRAVDSAFNAAEGRMDRFKASAREINQVMREALAGGLNELGRLDLGVSNFRQSAAEARLLEESLKLTESAARQLAVVTGDTSQRTADYIKALNGEKNAAVEARQAAEAQVATYERLQGQLDGMIDRAGALAAAYRDVYAEQAKQARLEVDQRRLQDQIGGAVAPALTARATDNGAGYRELERLAQAEQRYEASLRELISQIDPVTFAEARRREQIALLTQAIERNDITERQHAAYLAMVNAEYIRNAQSTSAQRFAYIQLGQQLQDVAIQAQLGVNPLVILTQQGTQAAFAMSALEGRVGAVARFFSGPWGAALTIATVALGTLVASSWEGEKATKALALASDGLAETQSVLGGMFDLVSGKLIKQNELLRLNAQLRLISLQDEADTARAAAQKTSAGIGLSSSTYFTAGGLAEGGDIALFQQANEARARVRSTLDRVIAGTLDADTAIKSVDANDLKSLDIDLRTYREALVNAVTARAKGATAEAIRESLKDGKLVEALRKPDKTKHTGLASINEQGEDAAKKIANIVDQFNDMPSQVAKVNKAMRELDDLADDFSKKKPKNFDEIQKAIVAARGVLENALNKPLEDYLEKSREQAVIQDLILRGRVDEAAALRTTIGLKEAMGPLDKQQLADVLRTTTAEREHNILLERRSKLRQQDVQAVRSVESSIQTGLANLRREGARAVGDIFENIQIAFDQRLSQQIMDSLFGNLFDDLAQQFSGVKSASEDVLIKALLDAGIKVEAFGNATAKAANQVAGTTVASDGTTSAADAAITVLGKRSGASGSAFVTIFTGLFGKFLGNNSPLAQGLGKISANMLEGAAYGGIAGSLVLGSGGSKAGSAIGGAIGEVAGKELAKGTLGKALGKFGEALGPLGGIVGGLLGGVVGNLFRKAPSATAVITSVSGAASVTGNNTAAQQAVTGVSVNLQSSLEKIIDQLGGIAGTFQVSIGQYNDYYRVKSDGSASAGAKHPGDANLIYNGPDANEALRVAILDAVSDGAVQGIRDGTRRLLTQNKDIDIGLSKATKFEQVFKDLKKATDPVGAAIDELNVKFRGLKNIFTEAGASAEEFAQLEELYGRQRAEAIKQASESLTSSLDALLKDLTQGDNGLSLRDRLAAATQSYTSVRDRVAAGDTTAYAEYGDAAKTMLELERQLYGSQSQYFAALNEVTNFTKGTLDAQKAKIDAATGSGSPFDATPIVNATQSQTNALIGALQPQLNSIAASNAVTAQEMRALVAAMSRGDYYGAMLENSDNF